MKQQSFKQSNPSLYLVATPIGNLDEMTVRAINTLNQVDIIASEDTRHSKQLCNHFKIDTPLISYHEHNEIHSSNGILELLKQGKSVALISDAGYPCLCDPGHVLVKACIEQGFAVIPISGPNAAINALVASGIAPYPYLFIGFLPHKSHGRIQTLKKYADFETTLVFYESVHRIVSTLEIILEHLGDRNICLAREISKLNEEFIRGSVSEVLKDLSVLKGEFVVCLEGRPKQEMVVEETDLISLVKEQVDKGLSVKQASGVIAEKTGQSKKQLYDMYIKSDR